jgi:hypothetical protein
MRGEGARHGQPRGGGGCLPEKRTPDTPHRWFLLAVLTRGPWASDKRHGWIGRYGVPGKSFAVRGSLLVGELDRAVQ